MPLPATPPALDAATPAARHALQRAIARLQAAQAGGRAWSQAEACRQVAAAYRRLAALPQTVTMLEHACRWARAAGGADQQADLLCELAESLADLADATAEARPADARAARRHAREHVLEASRLAAHVSDPRWEVTVLLRLSDVLDRFGDRDDATELQMRAVQLSVGSHVPAAGAAAADASGQPVH